MSVQISRRRRHRHRLTRTLAAALLVTVLIGVPAAETVDRSAAYITTGER